MSVVSTDEPRQRAEARGRSRSWGWAQYLALAGVPILALEVWTLAAWAAHGPRFVTQYWSPAGSPDWWKARTIEGLSLLVALYVLGRLYRDCRAQRRFLTFDVMFCLTAATMFWASGVVNFFTPMFSYSSNLLSVNDPCSFIPGVVNPDCGRIPNPFFVTVLETFMVLAVVIAVSALVDRLRRRDPGISRSRLCWFIFAVCCGFCVLEPLVIIPLKGWVWPGTPISLDAGGSYRYPIFPELFCFGGFLAVPAFVRIFKDDRGRTVVERNLEHYGPRRRTAVTFMALYTVMQFAVWIPGTAPLWLLGLHQREWVALPAHLNNGICDQPGIAEGTAYGPCPGSPGFRMPLAGQPGTPNVHS